VAVALDIGRGLAAAHARGIVHRDLKPENVFLRSGGGAKVLDFGLAKLQSAVGSLEESQTLTGFIVGTAGYMAPEQVKGEAIDTRADLFALGVILYEMLAGHPFRRSNAIETVHAVIAVDPPELATLNDRVPPALARVVMRLLRKAPEARFQSALDLVWALEQVAAGIASDSSSAARRLAPAPKRSARTPALIAALAAPVLAAVLVAGWWLAGRAARAPRAAGLTQFTLTLPAGISLDSAPVVSPDSRTIAFVGREGATPRLFVRGLGERSAVAIAGTEGAQHPFWSPDGGSLGYFARRRLMTVTWPGGAPIAVAEAPFARGGTWSRTGDILFGPDVILEGIRRTPAGGGAVVPATVLESSRGDTSHWWPHVLPDGEHFLYFVRSDSGDRRGVYLGGGEPSASIAATPILHSDSDAVYATLDDGESGVLLYVIDGRFEARRFDPARRSLGADARVLELAVDRGTLYHPMLLSASADVLALVEDPIPSGARLETVDRDGEVLRRWSEPEAQNWPRVSPDGTRIARQRVHPVTNNPDLWVEDLERGTLIRVTTGPEPDLQPVWSPDGRHLAYVSGQLPGRAGERTLRIAAADGSGVVRETPCPKSYCEPTDWSRHADELLVNVEEDGARDVWSVPAIETGTARPLLAAAFVERDARLSPDGRWIAYVSEESGRPEVSVRSVAGPERRVVVSATGGDQPTWRRDGAELFFVEPAGRLLSVAVRWIDQEPKFGLPTELEVPPVGFGHWGTQYDVAPDGGVIYALRANQDPAPREIQVVMGWRALLE
jgi:Tol biopolymer transport system component